MVMPLGLPALANLISDDVGTTPTIVHLGIEREVDPSFSLRELIVQTRPGLVFISLHWYLQTRSVINAAQRVKTWSPSTRVVLGGLTATVFAREVIEQLRFVDAVVRGDGEAAVTALSLASVGDSLTDAELARVPNLVWRDRAGGLHDNGLSFRLDAGLASRLRHGDLSSLRNRQAYLQRALYADFSEGGQHGGYAAAAYLNAGRGCAVTCANCGGAAPAQRAICGRDGVLLYPLEKLERDVDDVVAQGARLLRMSFDPPQARRHIESWLCTLGRSPRLGLVYDLWHLPTESLLTAMAAAFEPGSTLILSPECGSEEVRYRLRGLPFTNEQLMRAIARIESYGLRAHCFFSAGLPTESPDDIEKSVALIERIRCETSSGISVCPMVVDPGSPLFRDPAMFHATLTRKTLRDFYEEKGVPNGPGYATSHFSEHEIMAACDRLLCAAGLPSAFAT